MSHRPTSSRQHDLRGSTCYGISAGVALLGTLLVACDAKILRTTRDQRGKISRPTTTTAETTTDADGATVGRLSANSSGDQLVTANAAALQGASLSLPAGAIGIDLDVTITEGAALATADTATSLGIASDDVAAAGPTVVFNPSQAVEASVPFTLSIPLEAASLLLKSEDRYSVLYKAITVAADGSKGYELGLIPTAEIQRDGNAISFATTRFGAFQAVKTKVEITQKIAVASYEPIAVKESTSNPLLGKWQRSCEAESSKEHSEGTSGNASTTATSGAALADGQPRYRTESLSMSQDGFSFIGSTFTTADCSGPFLSQEGYSGTYILIGDSPELAGAKRIDIKFASAIRTFGTAEAVHHVNQTRLCGFADWKLGEPRDVIEVDCGDEGGPGKDLLMRQIIQQSGGSLRFGNDHGLDDDEYPTTLEPEEKAFRRLP